MGRVAGSIATLMVWARSWAEIPVVTPSRASIASQKAVPYCDVFSLVMGPMRRWSSRSSVMARQTRPRPCLAMKLMASGVTFSAAKREIAFILAILVVNHDDHSPGADLFDRGGDVGKG